MRGSEEMECTNSFSFYKRTACLLKVDSMPLQGPLKDLLLPLQLINNSLPTRALAMPAVGRTHTAPNTRGVEMLMTLFLLFI